MTDIKTHCILRSFIALCRGEAFEACTKEKLYHDAFWCSERQPEMANVKVEWSISERLFNTLTEHRGLTEQDMFDKGIVSMPGRLASRLISQILRKGFGIDELASLPYFDRRGEFMRNRKYDLIFPARENGLMSELKFYTLRDLHKRVRKQAA